MNSETTGPPAPVTWIAFSGVGPVPRRPFCRDDLLLHGDDGQVVPSTTRPGSRPLLPSGTLKVNPGFSHGMPITEASTIDADRLESIRS